MELPKTIEITGEPEEIVLQLIYAWLESIEDQSCDMCAHPTDWSGELCCECMDEPVPKHRISVEPPEGGESRMVPLDIYAPGQKNWKKHFELNDKAKQFLDNADEHLKGVVESEGEDEGST